MIDLGFLLLKVKLFLLPVVVDSGLHVDLYCGDPREIRGFAYLHSYAREGKECNTPSSIPIFILIKYSILFVRGDGFRVNSCPEVYFSFNLQHHVSFNETPSILSPSRGHYSTCWGLVSSSPEKRWGDARAPPALRSTNPKR